MGEFLLTQLEDEYNRVIKSIYTLATKVRDEATRLLMDTAPDADTINDLIYAEDALRELMADYLGIVEDKDE
jgi:hypothetical protein